jgi:5-methylcytosine-specific restriction endonuclease McrA
MNQLDRKVWSLTSPLRLKDKVPLVRKMLEAAIASPCRYCGRTLTLDNISIDHRQPISEFWPGAYKNLAKIPKEIRQLADRAENLQVVCRKCNGDKGNFTEEEMGMLIALPFWDKIRRRLASAKSFWKNRRSAQPSNRNNG